MSLVILKAFLALLLHGKVMNISRFLTILWFIPWGNWVPNVLIQWSSHLSLSDLFLCELPWWGICSMGYKIIFSSAPKQMLSASLKCLDTGPFSFLRISDMCWTFYLLNNGLFLQQALHSIRYFSTNNLIPQIMKNQSITKMWFFI